MELPRLEITRQDAEIEIRTHKAKVEITSHRPQFRLRRSLARFRMDYRLPVMRIDRTAVYQALGIGPVLQSARQYFMSSAQLAAENTGALSAEGDAMMRIEQGGNAVADIGVQSLESPELNLDLSMPPPPQVDWDPGFIHINWTPGALETEWDVSVRADIRVEPHYVEIRMKKYPGIRIRVAYDAKNQKAGGKIVDRYV